MESFTMTDKPPYFEMGQRIIKARENLTEMKQTQMTEALGLKEPTYGNYERGTRKMPPHVLEKFKEITGCRADYIYLGTGEMTSNDPTIPWLKMRQELTEKEQEAFDAYAENFFKMKELMEE